MIVQRIAMRPLKIEQVFVHMRDDITHPGPRPPDYYYLQRSGVMPDGVTRALRVRRTVYYEPDGGNRVAGRVRIRIEGQPVLMHILTVPHTHWGTWRLRKRFALALLAKRVETGGGNCGN